MSSVAVAQHGHADSREFTAQPLGKIGVWWFLASEIMVFGGLIGSYILCRIAAGGWAVERAHVNTRIAIFNTLVLVTSSLTVVKAHAAAETNDRSAARRFMLFTVLLGCTFLCVKFYEYSHEIEHGFTPATGTFWSFYYTMTGLHGLHVFGGIVLNFILFLACGGKAWERIKHRIEYAGLYWHFVDVVWIFLFPLLYLA
ncbi:MAG TPA: heme-copper oxidase subunit III [Candidatus Binatia bacterium]|nr:heme-copper oxidase subunit III [Candidatus Binatia bacterium]